MGKCGAGTPGLLQLRRSRSFDNGRRKDEIKCRETRQGQNPKEVKEGRDSFYILVFVIFAYMYTLSQG
jgi:hypothetical protein